MNALLLTLAVLLCVALVFAGVFAAVWKFIHIIARAEIRRKTRRAALTGASH